MDAGGIRLLAMDVDGTLTDGKIYMGSNGELFKAFNVKDGAGICSILPAYGITPAVITARSSEIVRLRCRELGIGEVYQGEQNKIARLEAMLYEKSRESGVRHTLRNVAYIGDDLADLPCIIQVKEAGGLTGCPNDAAKEVRGACDFVSSKNGGCGAVRDFIEWMLDAQRSK